MTVEGEAPAPPVLGMTVERGPRAACVRVLSPYDVTLSEASAVPPYDVTLSEASALSPYDVTLSEASVSERSRRVPARAAA